MTYRYRDVSSCDNDAIPESKVERWMPETFPSELDLLAADE
jgi:hypothetical protein